MLNVCHRWYVNSNPVYKKYWELMLAELNLEGNRFDNEDHRRQTIKDFTPWSARQE